MTRPFAAGEPPSVLSSNERRSARDDPAGQHGYGHRAGVNIAGAPVGVGAPQTEEEHLRHKQDQQRHERAAEGRTEQHVRAA